jgi:L-malate glycosyltransferase
LVIPNGIDINSFNNVSRSTSATNLRIGMLNVGFSSRKNVQTALRAWAIARVGYPTATLVAAGPGYEAGGEAHRWAVDSGLDIQVDFVGPIDSDSVPSWFSSLDVFLHPSVEESFGMVLLEAMAAGLPVIAGENAGAVPAVTGGRALLTDIHSSSSIANALVRIFTDAALRTQLGSDGLAWCQGFSVAESARRYIQELSNIAATTK